MSEEQNPEQKTLEDLTVIEVKALLFDLENDIKVKQQQYQAVFNYFTNKLEKEAK